MTDVVVRDGGVPGGKRARGEIVKSAIRSSFDLLSERQFNSDGIEFVMWVFAR